MYGGEEIDIDKFKAAKRIKISSLIGLSKDISGDDPSALKVSPNPYEDPGCQETNSP